MDAESVKAILDYQRKENEKFQNTMMEMVKQMFAQMGPSEVRTSTAAVTGSNATKIIDSLAARLPLFQFDPENGCTFDNWYNRYEDVLSKDGAEIDDDAKKRLILEKMDSQSYSHFSNMILPKKPAEMTFTDTVKRLQELFGHSRSVFRRRFEFLQTEYHGDGLDEYTGLIKRRFALAEWNAMTEEQLACMVWIAGLRDNEYAEIRTRALQMLEARPEITLLQLEMDIKKILEIREDSKILGTGRNPPTINAVKHKKDKKENLSTPPSPCHRCNGPHWSKDCKFNKDTVCNKCSKKGHIAVACGKFKSKSKKANRIVVINQTKTEATRIYHHVIINDSKVKMQLDTGAEVTLLSNRDWIKLNRPKLQPATVVLKSANNTPIDVKGQFKCKFVLNGNLAEGICHVAETSTLLGMDWISKDPVLMKLLAGSVNAVSSTTLTTSKLDAIQKDLKDQLQLKHTSIFKAELGCCTKAKASLKLKPNAQPTFRKARPVPYAVVPRVSEELDRLVSAGVISPIDHSEWAAPIVVVQKKDGKIRMCADYSTGLNDSLQQHQHPLPTSEDIFTVLNGGKFFSTLDLAEAYLQVEVEESSKKLLTINTHRGLFQYNRMPFGVKTAPAIFQQITDALVCGIPGTAAYLDDIIIAGATVEEHNQRLEAVLHQIDNYGFHVKLEKCSFLQPEIKFLGFIVDTNGRRPDPAKIVAINNMPPPQDVSQLRSFLGMMQFYGSFVPELHNVRKPLDALLQQEAKFIWSPQCQAAFDTVKSKLNSDLLLTHFDPQLPLIVAADASNFGIGAVLSHRFPDGSEKAIYHASRTLTAAQKNYSQIEKEGLALIFGIQKFHRFIHGRQFTLKTDHKPLLSIFGSKKGIPVYSANRLQRWATMLLNYNFQIEYVNTKNFGQADALSRLISTQQKEMEREDRVIARIEAETVAEYTEHCQNLPVSAEMIRTATSKDRLLRQVMDCCKDGKWPEIRRDSPLWSYYNRREGLTIVQDCLLSAHRIVIPKSLQHRVLKALHKAHPGSTRMKMLSRSFVYWPTLDQDIDSLVRNCGNCAAAAKNPIKAELHSWSAPTAPWTRIHADFAGPMEGMYYFVVVDAYSKWPEIIPTRNITSSTTISMLKPIFSQFGNPETLVTDNGTQFTSKLFADFCRSRGINHVRSPPFHPQSNGQAERFVDTFKRGILKLKGEEATPEALQTFLQSYRSTPCPSSPNKKSPAENFLGRRLRTTLDLLLPSFESTTSTRDSKMEQQFNRHHCAHTREFQINQPVFIRDYRGTKATWTPGAILRRTGNVTYLVRCRNQIWTRHTNQLRGRDLPSTKDALFNVFELAPPTKEVPPTTSISTTTPTVVAATAPAATAPTTCVPTPPAARPSRLRRPTTRLKVDPRQKSYKD